MSKVCTLFLTTAFVIAASSSTASGVKLLTVPRSSVVVIGDKVELNCSIDGNYTLVWVFNSWNTSTFTILYLGRGIQYHVRSRYYRISGQHNLIINSADMAHAGRYICVTSGVSPVQNADAQLTVLGTFPECSTNINTADKAIMEHGYLWMWCRVIYTRNMIPIFTWTKNNTRNPIAANTTTSDKRTLSLTTTSSVIAQLRSDDNGVIFKCKITFQLPNNTEGNAPDYEYTWNYTANVMYGPRNLSITRYEDRFEFSADGKPTPLYKWTQVETNRSTKGPTFMLHNKTTSDKAYTLQCTAVNAIATTNKNITDSNEKSTFNTAEAALIIASLSLAGCILLGLIIGLRKLSCFSNAAGETSDTIARASSIQMRPSSFGLQPELPTVIENQNSHTTATTVDYCTLTDRPSTMQESQLYCELRLYEPPSKVYINQPTSG